MTGVNSIIEGSRTIFSFLTWVFLLGGVAIVGLGLY
jgi:hypothetical protein